MKEMVGTIFVGNAGKDLKGTHQKINGNGSLPVFAKSTLLLFLKKGKRGPYIISISHCLKARMIRYFCGREPKK